MGTKCVIPMSLNLEVGNCGCGCKNGCGNDGCGCGGQGGCDCGKCCGCNCGGSGGTNDHAVLINRDLPDQHPISAITGLDNRLANIENSVLYYKGYYGTPEELEAAYPAAGLGDFATVGSTNTVWRWDGAEWTDTGVSGQVTAILMNGERLTGDVVVDLPALGLSSTPAELDDAAAKRHTHANKAVLDGIIGTGDGSKSLRDDGTYRAAGEEPVQLHFTVPGAFASAASSALLRSKAGTFYRWPFAPGKLQKISMRTVTPGSVPPTVNVTVNGTPVLETPITVSGNWIDVAADFAVPADAEFELTTTARADASDLTVSLLLEV